jgi:hypothetical protein
LCYFYIFFHFARFGRKTLQIYQDPTPQFWICLLQ